ncbi:hypothetical protein [Kribbella sp. NPDC023855]|uniref:NucA/NucB deoxyribonuclease domain-containing protein n=1 Tax=Kribbella sp. NPDC023855 TaxID=3154698 RepID=UPI0033FA1301
MKFRRIIAATLVLTSGSVGTALAGNTGPPSSTVSQSAPPTSAIAAPKPVPPFKPLPRGATGAEIQKALHTYASSTGQTYTVNGADFRPGSRPKSKPAMAPAAVPDRFTYLTPEQCRTKPEGRMDFASNYVGKIQNHWQWCGWIDMQAYTTTPHLLTGVPVKNASIDFRLTIIGWGSSTDSSIKFNLYVDNIRNPIKMTPQNTSLTFRPWCDGMSGGSCSLPNAQTGTIAALSTGAVSMTTTVNLPTASATNPDRITTFLAGINVEDTSTLAPGQIATIGSIKPLIRCDGATAPNRGGFTTNACIYPGVSAAYSLSKSDPVIGEVAQHIYWAQTDPNSTTPLPAAGDQKSIPHEVQREVDPVKRDANGDVATHTCDTQLQQPRPPGKSCDEYPFRSTKQGAATGLNDYSVALITDTHNSLEGSQRGQWYTDDRYLDGDYFRVVVTP